MPDALCTLDRGILRQFGDRVRHLRLHRKLSQEELADEAGLDRSYIGGVERGERNVSLANIAKIARGLDVAVFELFDGGSKRRARKRR